MIAMINGVHAILFSKQAARTRTFLRDKLGFTSEGKVVAAGWGLLTRLRLPDGGTIGLYEPKHARPR